MKQRTIAILLSIMFATLTVASDAIMLLDFCDDDEVLTLIMDSSEEEERKGEEKIKDFKIQITRDTQLDCVYSSLEKAKHLSFHLNNYNSIIKELTSPPPELKI